jgi:hypothetical protein
MLWRIKADREFQQAASTASLSNDRRSSGVALTHFRSYIRGPSDDPRHQSLSDQPLCIFVSDLAAS